MVHHIVISILLSLFSTAVMSYIAIATPIGPWIDPTLVLIGLILFKVMLQPITTTSMALVVSSGAIGGIMATACGFSFPAIYFLDPITFNSWVANPVYFAGLLSSLALSAGWFGMWIANALEKSLLVQEHLSFPIGQLIYKMISAQNQIHRAYELVAGFALSMVTGILQGGLCGLRSIIPRSVALVTSRSIGFVTMPSIVLDMSIVPMSVAIGFVTGHVIALPLLCGALLRIGLLDPLNCNYFHYLSHTEFLLAFCSGMILTGAILSLITLPKQLYAFVRRIAQGDTASLFHNHVHMHARVIELGVWFLFSSIFFYYLGCSLWVQLYLFICTYACCYVMALIAGKIGIAHLGRYATFVMVPAMFIFQLNYVHLICIATFVEIAGGVTVDVLFGRKVAQLAGVEMTRVKKYQYLGLLVSACAVGTIFWLLVSHFQLGSPQLFAYKAQARQLLIHAQKFDYTVLLLGIIAGYILKCIRLNPSLVLGGLLMPLNISVGLIIGGLGAYMCHDRERWYPFWSGIFAGNSIWMLINAFFCS